jgi:hypothetical protein
LKRICRVLCGILSWLLFRFSNKGEQMEFTANGRKYEMDEMSVTFAEGELIEELAGMPYGLAGAGMRQGSLRPIRAIMLVAIKRADPESLVTFDDLSNWEIENLQFSWDEVVRPKAPRAPRSPSKNKSI